MPKTVFQDGNALLGVKGSIVYAKFLNALNGHRHDGIDEDGHGELTYAVTTGTGSAYKVAFKPHLEQHIEGMPVFVKFHMANTGAATLQVHDLPAVPLLSQRGEPLQADHINAGQISTAIYDGSGYQLLQVARDKKDDGVPLLTILWETLGISREGYLDISKDNGLLLRSAFPDAWQLLEYAISVGSPAVVSESAWQAEAATNGGVCGKYSTGNGTTNFRVPLIAKRFVRATGSDLPVGTAQIDTMRPITGELSTGQAGSWGGILTPGSDMSGVFKEGRSSTTRPSPVNASATTVRIDSALLGANFSGTETRPVSVAMVPLLKMYGAPIDIGQLDLAALVQGLALKLDTAVYEAAAPLRVKAWATVAANGNITNSKNVTSVSRTATGVYTIYSPAITSSSIIFSATPDITDNAIFGLFPSVPLAGQARIRTWYQGLSSAYASDRLFSIAII